MRLLYDIHCHAMTLARPALGRFVDAFLAGGLESFFSQVAAPGYLVSAMALNGGDTIRNLLAAVENDPVALIELIEDDLAGVYARSLAAAPSSSAQGRIGPKATEAPILGPQGLALLGESWDAYLICPLLMDFGARAVGTSTYYSAPPRKALEEGVREILAGMAGYRRERPNGRLVVRPFLGIDPGGRGAAATEAALDRYFAGYSRRPAAQLSAFKAAARWKGDARRPPRGSFAGIKLYPPLGFDPWPQDPGELDATRLLYAFCERRGVPIVVHCDDQGYRTIGLGKAMAVTDPGRWYAVLSEYPELIVDFAHFGERYLGRPRDRESWTRTIVALMDRYPGVYADVAFNGCDPGYWSRLERFLDSLPARAADRARSRLLFGTDFVISLAKSRSYRDYVVDFASGPLDAALKRAMMAENPGRYLMGDALGSGTKLRGV